MRFRDRTDAGEQLATAVATLQLPDPVVIGLPRGGVVVAAPVARSLGVRLSLLVVRKVGLPGRPELGIGAVAEGGVTVVDPDALTAYGIDEQHFLALADAERVELERRVARYGAHGGDVLGRDVVLVDDGLATGSTAEAAIEAARMRKPRRVVLAVPVAAPDPLSRLRGIADQVVCLSEPPGFQSVGQWYDDFAQVTDEEVLTLMTSPTP